MASFLHSAFCFEVINASLEHQDPPTLGKVVKLWNHYVAARGGSGEEKEQRGTAHHESSPGLQNEYASVGPNAPSEAPLFVTWETISSDESRRLRGCIGTFEPLELEEGLKTYARIAAFEDHRFRPIVKRELSTLECGVTLLTDFESASEPMDWEIGKHGIRISFYHNGRKYGSTYLPDVVVEQGWTKTEALVSLMRKAGWSGRSSEWNQVKDLKVIRYQGKKAALSFEEWEEFHTWSTTFD